MRLATRLLLFILPPIVLSFLLFGMWSFEQQKRSLLSAHQSVLTERLLGFLQTEVSRRHNILRKNGLDAVPSSVARFQQEVCRQADNIFTGPSPRLLILGEDGKLVHVSGFLTGETAGILREVQQLLTGVTEQGHFVYHGENYNFFTQLFPPWQWRLVLVEHSGAVDHLVRSVQLLVFFATVVMVSLLVAAVFLLSRKYVLQPLQQLAEAAEAIGRDRAPAGLPTTGCVEIDHLARAMDEMAASLAEGDRRGQALQRQLSRQEKLAAIGRMAATVRHDLKNPLGAISNSVYFLRARLVDPEEKVARHLDLIDSQVEHSLAVISSLLDFSKTVALEQKPHHLKSLVEECVAASVPDEVEVSVAIAEDIATVAMDRVQMSRVLRNILENSVQAMDSRGRIDISCVRDGGWLEITVRDSGPGIPAALLERIFEPFFTTRKDGTGLGLAGARSIIELHGGTLVAENRATGGACLVIRLPFKN